MSCERKGKQSRLLDRIADGVASNFGPAFPTTQPSESRFRKAGGREPLNSLILLNLRRRAALTSEAPTGRIRDETG